jgi:GT2 family glycosyltransferase
MIVGQAPRLISSGDLEFGVRAWRAGVRQFFAKDIIMYHPARKSIKGLFKKSFRIGRGKCQLLSYHPVFKNNFKLLNYFFLNPIYFLKKMRGRKRKYKFKWIFLIIFYLIKWSNNIATLSGYFYERRLLKKQYYL